MNFDDLEVERERDLETRFVRAVRRAGGVVRKLEWVGMAGAPDRIVLLPGGRVMFAELKRPDGKGRVSAAQRRELALLQALGFVAPVIDSDEGIREFLARM